MKINVACGKMVLDGWVNVDIQVHPKAKREPEILSDVRSIPLDDECANEVMAIHIIEHFYFWEAPDVINEWKRLLKPGGKLILELPNLEAACKNVLQGKKDQLGMWPLYGDPTMRDPYMCHKWAYTPRTMRELLELCRFRVIYFKSPEYHGKRINRDMRVEAIK